MPANKWYTYLLCCKDGSLYCGITTDLSRRLREHNDSLAGARYTRTRRPVTLVYSREFLDRAAAARFEYRLKQLDRDKKLALITEPDRYPAVD